MRFLQMQWHDHERARNAWDIERAEIKHRIGKQEGDLRKQKQINQALEKQVRMLEQALKNERAKAKALRAGTASNEEEAKESANGKGAVKPASKSAMAEPRREHHLAHLLRANQVSADTFRSGNQASQFLP